MEPFPMQALGKILIMLGSVVVVIGLLMVFGNKIPFFGRLPGDIVVHRKNFTFYFPITTLIVLNLLFILISYLLRK